MAGDIAYSWLKAAAAPRWMVLFFLLTAASALAISQDWLEATPTMVAPFALLVVNLLAAIIVMPRFRADLPLLIFHIALLAFVALVVVARLTYFSAGATLNNGSLFDGQAEKVEKGSFHWGRVEDIRFINDGLVAHYSEQGEYLGLFNRLRWLDERGGWHQAVIGDDRSLTLNGYRIYVTRYRGYSPVFVWEPNEGDAQMGAVQIDAIFDEIVPPSAQWSIPNGPDLWLMLDYPPLEDQPKGPQGNLGADRLPHQLIIRHAERRETLQVGDSLQFPEGRLTYQRLDSWLNYKFAYDPTLPWIVATLVVGVASLVWFYVGRIWGPSREAPA